MKKKLSGFEIFVYAALVIGVVYLFVTSFGGTKTFWGWDAKQAGWGWKIVMLAHVAAVGFIVYIRRNKGIPPAYGFLFLALLGGGFASSTGYKFSGGDIKQRITYLDNLGHVKDTTVLFNCYEGFYHFNENPELKKYVIEYGELPGRNLWNAYILSGEEPKSTAPRANEDFKWHTGAYELQIPNGCGK